MVTSTWILDIFSSPFYVPYYVFAYTRHLLFFMIREGLLERRLCSILNFVSYIIISWDSCSLDYDVLKGKDFSLRVFVAPSLPFQFVLTDICEVGWIHMSHTEAFRSSKSFRRQMIMKE